MITNKQDIWTFEHGKDICKNLGKIFLARNVLRNLKIRKRMRHMPENKTKGEQPSRTTGKKNNQRTIMGPLPRSKA